MFLPNTHSFSLSRRQRVEPDFSSATETATTVISEVDTVLGNERAFLPNTHSFLLTRRQRIGSNVPSVTGITTAAIAQGESPATSPAGHTEAVVGDFDKRKFLKVAGIAGAGLIASQVLPNKASALVLGSSPTSGVVGVKNVSNARINPATEETLDTVLKTSDLTFDAGALEVKVTSLPAGGSSFSDSGNVAKSGLVDADRHVQVDVLSSALPTSASTETTLQTISFGGYKFSLRLATVGDVDYVGEAAIGTATSAASWRIKKVDSSSGMVLQWAGTGVFDQVWDNRASLSYS